EMCQYLHRAWGIAAKAKNKISLGVHEYFVAEELHFCARRGFAFQQRALDPLAFDFYFRFRIQGEYTLRHQEKVQNRQSSKSLSRQYPGLLRPDSARCAQYAPAAFQDTVRNAGNHRGYSGWENKNRFGKNPPQHSRDRKTNQSLYAPPH